VSRPAQFYGHCQWCGSRQKLPGGVLSLHGYEVSSWGFFEGICSGARHLPFEQSKDLIDESIAFAQHKRANLMLKRGLALVVDPASTNKSWRDVYHPELSSRTRGSVRLWHLGEFKTDDSGRVRSFEYGDGKIDRVHEGGKPLVSLVREGYVRYAQHLAGQVAQIEQFIAWQRERIANWVPAELEPVEKAVA